MASKSLNLLCDVHVGLAPPESCTFCSLVKGPYSFFHYCCDGTDDRGWGCGYRTAQTLCSWVYNQEKEQLRDPTPVPTLNDIQEVLVSVGDKPPHFVGSKFWIGTYEAFLTLDQLYNVQCRIVHLQNRREFPQHADALIRHFEDVGCPVMMGGDTDASSKGILGVCGNKSNMYVLVLDPHMSKKAHEVSQVQQPGWIRWHNVEDFSDSSFYNLCLPLYPPDSVSPN